MDRQNYLDFDLQIETVAQGYQAQVLNSPAGQATGSFKLPFSPPQLEALLAQMGQAGATKDEAAREFGWKLFNAVFGRELETLLRNSFGEADRQQSGLRIRLHLGQAAALQALPWEYLYYPSFNSFLALSENTALMRYLETPVEQPASPPSKLPLKILVLISNPTDYTQFDTETEWTGLNAALAALQQKNLVQLERLEAVDLDGLRQKLEQSQFHILHFIGHGGFDWQNEGLLILQDAKGQGLPTSGQALTELMQAHPALRLVVLRAWEGVRTAGREPFGSLGQVLVRQGLAAVVSSQFEISDEAVNSLSTEFYNWLALGYPVDLALSAARQQLSRDGNQSEWGRLLLYTNVKDGQIFNLEPLSEELQTELRIAALYKEAQYALDQEEWSVAVQKLGAILALDPGQAQAAEQLAAAQNQQVWAALYAQATQYYTARQWRESLESLYELQKETPAYKDVTTLIADSEARLAQERQERIVTLYSEAEAAIRQQDWANAVIKLRTILSLDAAQTEAQPQLDRVRQEQAWAALYATGQGHYEGGRWQAALDCFRQLQDETPGYRDVPRMITTLETRLAQVQAEAATPVPPVPLFLASAQAGGAANYPQQATSQSEALVATPATPSQQQEWDTLYAIGRYHYDVQNWQEALSCFRQLQASAGDFRDIATLIAACEARLAQPPPQILQLEAPQAVPQPAPVLVAAPSPAMPVMTPYLPPPFSSAPRPRGRDLTSLWLSLILIFWLLVPIILVIMLLIRR